MRMSRRKHLPGVPKNCILWSVLKENVGLIKLVLQARPARR